MNSTTISTVSDSAAANGSFAHPRRIADLRVRMLQANVDALIVSHIENARYLTGFTGSNALLLLTPGEAIFLTDGRYKLQSAHEVPGFERIILPQGSVLAEAVADEAAKRNIARVAFESHNLTVEDYEKMRAKMPERIDMLRHTNLVEGVRYIKDADEVAAMRRAIALADACWLYIQTITKSGVTERELAWNIEVFLRENGAAALGFETIVASGPNSALPHARPSDRVISKNGETEFVLFDYGCLLDGYCSDITRTLLVGTPTPEHHKLYNAVRRAQQAALDAIRPGVAGKAVDDVARAVFAEEGLADNFTHGLGHALGRVVHDGPMFSQKSEVTLAVGMVGTVEPGAYIEGFGGVRIEDDVVVTETGCEILTKSAKDLVVIT